MRVLIVGGGPSGLTACYNVAKKAKDADIVLVEMQSRCGGLAKSFVYEGQYTFDIGPKRFHTEDPDVLGFIHEISALCPLTTIGRSSKVHFLGRIFDWPLHGKSLAKLPPTIGLRAARDLLRRKTFTEKDMLLFENYIISRYGETLFQIFFKPYTEKFLQWPIDDIHSDWASTGINRSIINKEHKGNSLLELIHKVVLPKPVAANFLYPTHGGFGAFWDACSRIVMENPKVQMKTSTSVRSLRIDNDRCTALLSDGSESIFDYVLWSGRLPDLLRAMGLPSQSLPALHYLDTVFFDLVFDESAIRSREAICQWLYVSAGNLAISRISFPQCLLASNIPSGKQGLCVEVTLKEDAPFHDPNALLQRVLRELKDMHILQENAVPIFANVHREQATYPIYHRHYREAVAASLQAVQDFSDRVICMGRCGSYWYNNSDHSIKQALKLTTDLLEGAPPSFDCYGWFGGVKRPSPTVKTASPLVTV